MSAAPISDEDAFRAQMAKYVLHPDSLPRGVVVQFRVQGDSEDQRSGWAILHPNGTGSFGNHRRGLRINWLPTGLPSAAELAARENARRARAVARERQREETQARARKLLLQATPADPSHPFLVLHKIEPHGALSFNGSLVLPMFDAAGAVYSAQFCERDGTTRYLSGTDVDGLSFPVGSTMRGVARVAASFAEAARTVEALGGTCLCAFDHDNVEAVAVALRRKYASFRIEVVGDHDHAVRAAQSVGGYVVAQPGVQAHEASDG